jgi:hypothetical protein
MTPDDRVRAAAAVIALCAAATARAQSPEAEVLFRDGRRLIQAGQLAEGCDKLEASERLESSVGALLNLGDCRERLGELASAWAAFRKAEAKARRAADEERRRIEARRRAAALEPRLSYLVLQIEARIDGLTVRRNGVPVDPALWNTPVPIDPGLYEIVVEAPAREPWRTAVTIDAAARRRVIPVPPLEAQPAAEPTLPPAVAKGPAPANRRGSRTWSTAREVAAGLAAVGAGTLGAGAYYGWRTRDLAERSDRKCPLVVCGDAEGLELNDRARSAALRANVLYAAGGAAAAAATILWLAGKPGGTEVSPGVAGGVGVSVRGSF